MIKALVVILLIFLILGIAILEIFIMINLSKITKMEEEEDLKEQATKILDKK